MTSADAPTNTIKIETIPAMRPVYPQLSKSSLISVAFKSDKASLDQLRQSRGNLKLDVPLLPGVIRPNRHVLTLDFEIEGHLADVHYLAEPQPDRKGEFFRRGA